MYSKAFIIFLIIAISSGVSATSELESASAKSPHGFTCLEITPDLANVLAKLKDKPEISNSGDKINLELYTRLSNKTMIAKNGELVDIHRSNFRAERRTVVITHGFWTDSAPAWMMPLVNAYLIYEDVNVIIVDWSMFTIGGDYFIAVSNVQNAAQQAADLFVAIVNEFENVTSWPDIHMIGFSLGAHVVSNIAHKLHNDQRVWKIGRITGLDPAAPCYQDSPWRLNKSAAPFVDVIHTNGDANSGFPFGVTAPIGHLDFYVNGGEVQPGCDVLDSFLDKLIDVLLPGLTCAKCSHERAPLYFIESLEIANARTEPPLMGIKWNRSELAPALDFLHNNTCTTKCVVMGINAHNRDEDSSGVYFVPAGGQKPFNKILPKDKAKIEAVLRERI